MSGWFPLSLSPSKGERHAHGIAGGIGGLPDTALNTRSFLAGVVEAARRRLPDELRDFNVVGPWASLVKLHYGNPAIHYEVWVQRRTGIVEIGIHFEGPAERNSYYLESLIQKSDRIIHALGPEIEPEQWTPVWTRIHYPLPMSELDEALLARVSERMVNLVRTLEPLVRELHMPHT